MTRVSFIPRPRWVHSNLGPLWALSHSSWRIIQNPLANVDPRFSDPLQAKRPRPIWTYLDNHYVTKFQLLTSWWFGARWVGLVKAGFPFTLYKNQKFISPVLTNPNHQLRAWNPTRTFVMSHIPVARYFQLCAIRCIPSL